MNRRRCQSTDPLPPPTSGVAARRWLRALWFSLLWLPCQAHASIFKGEALDKMADVLTWVVLVVAPLVGIAVFWLVHILPEKIAEKRQHPQAGAIQCLCLMSLVFGGLLWPLAWLWAYSKPVLYKMAYGTDKVAHGHADQAHPSPEQAEAEKLKQLRQRLAEELQQHRQRIAEIETDLASKSAADGGKA